jgi:hypothetical protein
MIPQERIMQGTRTTSLTIALLAAAVAVAVAVAPVQGQSAPPPAGWSDRVPRVEGARHHFVSPDGKAGNGGTKEAPWDLASAFAGRDEVKPGDVVWVRGGTYKGSHELKLAGREGAPIHVRAYPGERATLLDGTLLIVSPASHVWVWDLEIATSTPPDQRVITESGSHPRLPATFADGINIRRTASSGVLKDLKLINLVIHDTSQGISFWIDAVDSEIHGCLIYDNGWKAPDRGHGHCIYTQNKDGIKTISSNIMSAKYDGAYTLHAYGSDRAYVDNFVAEDNIAYETGPFLIGGGRPSRNIKALGNSLYGVGMRIGYGAENEDCEVRDNLIAKGNLSIKGYKTVVAEGNREMLPGREVRLVPNKYDPNRAHLAVYNGAKASQVQVEVSEFLKPGEAFRLMDPRDFFGEPVVAGICSGSTVAVPMRGEFAPFVLLKVSPGHNHDIPRNGVDR